MKKGNISVFVPHIGCPQQCSFCNQKTITGHSAAPSASDVVQAVETALANNKDNKFEYEIAFFGGSFTAIERDYMLSLLGAAKPYVESGALKGIRVSTRPDAIDDEILSLLKSYCVTAIELGAQSMDDKVLAANLRGHTAQDVRAASALINASGFELGLQMMTDLYQSTPEKDIETAREFAKLNPKTVRIYPTVVLRGTYLAELFESGRYIPSPLEDTVSLCAELVEFFERQGIEVIRVGLHSSEDIKHNMLAGGYHESLGEMVISKIMLGRIMQNPPGDYQVYINEKSISKLLGNKKSNIIALHNAGYQLEIKFDNTLGGNEIKVV